MKKIHNYIMLLFIAFAVASCAEEEIIENKVVGKPGEEVKFSLSLGNGSRTVYEEGESAFPIYWVDGDKVQVYSPQASSSRNNAEYKVILPKGENGVVVEKPDYAGDLVKTGAYGVQWGEGYTDTDGNTGLHDFYSIYPSGNYAFYSDTEGNVFAPGVRVNASQTVYYEGTDVNSQNNGFVHAMSNCLMYAYTPKVDMSVGVVDLSYNPLSTVLWVEMKAADAPANPTADQIKNFKILGITLTSSEANIAGDFTLNVGDGSLHSWTTPTSGTKSIDITLRDKTLGEQVNYTLNAGQTVKFPIFIAPVSNWGNSVLKIAINTDQGTFTKTITSNSSSLEPGEIHKIKLPELNVNTAEEWDVATWMRYIPRNVYLSEVSIPGSWDTVNGERQGSTDIETQYSKGVRAFHFDTRWRTSSTGSFLGYTSGNINALSVAGAASSSKFSDADSNNNRVVLGGGKTFEQYLDEIVGCLKDDEYMALICTFAQDSYDYSGTNGKWYSEISAICAKDKYDGILAEAEDITPNTLVGDMLGKLIVIVNMSSAINGNSELPSGGRCLFTYMPMMLGKSHFDGTDDHQDELWYTSIDEDNIETTSDTGIMIYNSQAQVTSNNATTGYDTGTNNRGYAPTINERTNVLNSILSWSKENYNKPDYEHNMWIYLGLGGYQVRNTSGDQVSNSSSTIASTFNAWISQKVNEMGTIPAGETEEIDYYPVGIVLMNYVTDTNYSSVVKDILMLNNRYTLKYDSNKPADYDPKYYQPGSGDGEGTEGGDIEL